MKPILFDATSTSFATQGLGVLSDCISCTITEELNGGYELTMKYPKNGLHAELIQPRSIIVCRASFGKSREAFRVYKCENDIKRTLTVYARHISYDLSNYPVMPFTASGIANALTGLKSNMPSGMSCPFTLETEKDSSATFAVDAPSSIRSWLGGKDGSLIDVYGGEWDYNNFNCTLLDKRGSGSSSAPVASIKYAKNLTSYNKEADADAQYTHIIAFWKKEAVVAYSAPQEVGEGADYTRCGYYDVSNDYQEQPTTAQLNAAAQSYISRNKLDGIAVNISVDFLQLPNERIELGDYVRIFNDGESFTSRIISMEWNVLLDRYNSLEVGDKKATIVDAIGSITGRSSEISSGVSFVDYIVETGNGNIGQQDTAEGEYHWRKWKSGKVELWSRRYIQLKFDSTWVAPVRNATIVTKKSTDGDRNIRFVFPTGLFTDTVPRIWADITNVVDINPCWLVHSGQGSATQSEQLWPLTINNSQSSAVGKIYIDLYAVQD